MAYRSLHFFLCTHGPECVKTDDCDRLWAARVKKRGWGNEQNRNEWRHRVGVLFTRVDCIPVNSRPVFFCPTCCDILRKWQTRSLFILLECEEKLSNARLCGLQQILSLGSLALKKIARWHMKTTISPHARLVNASQRVRRQVIAENFVNGKTPKMIADKLRVLKISQRSGQSNEWQ